MYINSEYNFWRKANCFKYFLPMHCPLLQSACSDESPVQLAPCGRSGGNSHVRARKWIPLPHDLVQSDQEPQFAQCPSTAREIQVYTSNSVLLKGLISFWLR